MPCSCRRPVTPTNVVITRIAPRGPTSHDQHIRVPAGTDSNSNDHRSVSPIAFSLV